MLLQARNRRLASDLASLQRQLEAKDAAMAQMQDRLGQHETVITRKDALIQQLEDDIFRSVDHGYMEHLPASKARRLLC